MLPKILQVEWRLHFIPFNKTYSLIVPLRDLLTEILSVLIPNKKFAFFLILKTEST